MCSPGENGWHLGGFPSGWDPGQGPGCWPHGDITSSPGTGAGFRVLLSRLIFYICEASYTNTCVCLHYLPDLKEWLFALSSGRLSRHAALSPARCCEQEGNFPRTWLSPGASASGSSRAPSAACWGELASLPARGASSGSPSPSRWPLPEVGSQGEGGWVLKCPGPGRPEDLHPVSLSAGRAQGVRAADDRCFEGGGTGPVGLQRQRGGAFSEVRELSL